MQRTVIVEQLFK